MVSNRNDKINYIPNNFFLSYKYFCFKLSGRISRNIGKNIFRSYTGSTSENTDFHILVA